ncbi:MAG TPA: AarF/UbiB family protein [Usitatibacter sp.]|nr:AarF/UbiB family protein [Usitatibacter sp.]
MKIDARHLQRYKQIARLLWKYGRSDLVTQMGIEDDATVKEPTPGEAELPAQLADDLEAMGPTFVKVGQVLSSRPDLLPDAYLESLSRLQDDVKPFPYADVERIVQEELQVRISKAFARFDPEPIAAASLGQVHAAALRDGREVVVKVQRPGVEKQVADDFEVIAGIAEFLDAHTEVGRRHRFAAMVEELRLSINRELNYEREAQNLESVGRNLERYPRIRIPQPIRDYCTRHVLTMEHVSGTKITKLSPVVRIEIDGEGLAEELFEAYLKQVLVDGLFHADPHPGNIFITDDGCIALLDLGMVGHTTPAMQASLLKILIAVSEGKGEDAAATVVNISDTVEGYDAAGFAKTVAKVVVDEHDRSLEQIDVGRTLLKLTAAAADFGIFVPSELTLLAKTLLQLDEAGKLLDPNFDPNAAIRRNVAKIMSQRVKKDATQGSILATVLEMKEFVAGLPGRLNKLMDAVTGKDLEVKVRVTDAGLFMEGLQKIANRVTSGLILASLIVGASLMMRVETSWRFWGYPGLAIICFLAAAAGGVWLLFNIYIQDRRSNEKAARSRNA